MDILLRILREVVFTPRFLFFVGVVVVFLVVRRWFHIRSHEKARGEHIAALTPLANSLGGTVTGPEGATTAWSALLRGPLVHEVDGFLNKLFQRSKPQFDVAMDFRRGPWHVRVTEASVRVAVVNGYGVRWEQEHRIEVATGRLAPMKILRPVSKDQRFEGWVTERPLTAERDQAGWHPVMLVPPMDEEFYACGSDPAAAQRALNPEALKWLLSRQDELPLPAQHMRLTFESGLAYAVFFDHVHPENLVTVVDTILGLLDRMPDARPRHPQTTA
jgi:hypothetical protein